MKNNLVKEIEKIVAQRQNSRAFLPTPTYLYVKHFGRDIEDCMEEITSLMGESEFFVFKTSRIQKTESILRSFLMELEKHAALGKEFKGCVLVELSAEIEPEELNDFLEYAVKQEQLKYLFTTKENVEEMQELLEQHFFVRVVKGLAYSCEEQLEILDEAFQKYHFAADEEAMDLFRKTFSEKEWQENDMVMNRIQNIAKNLVYEKMLSDENNNRCILKEDAQEAVKKLTKETQKRNVIGFYV